MATGRLPEYLLELVILETLLEGWADNRTEATKIIPDIIPLIQLTYRLQDNQTTIEKKELSLALSRMLKKELIRVSDFDIFKIYDNYMVSPNLNITQKGKSLLEEHRKEELAKSPSPVPQPKPAII